MTKIKLFLKEKTKYTVKTSTKFNKQILKIAKQQKDLAKIQKIILQLANAQPLPQKYRDHALTDSKHFKNCRECHITPDWLLVYRIENDILLLTLIATGSYSDLFNK